MLTVKDLEKYFDESQSSMIGFKGHCHDCGKDVTIDIDLLEDGTVTVEGGALYKAQVGPTPADMKLFMKCDACYEQNKVVTSYRPCDVYSRVVGYLTPVNQWNEGKQAERLLRKDFHV